MHFLTEHDVRERCPQPGSTLRLAATERLTPSGAELAARLRIKVVQEGECAPCPEPARTAPEAARSTAPECASGDCCMTHLDAASMAPKSHARIVLRGKLDTLLAVTVLIQTQFDPKNRLSGFLKECLCDLHAWIMNALMAEVSGNPLGACGMGGMDTEALHAVSREPARYLDVEHCAPEASLGGNIALLNWLRALARETEVAAVQCACRTDICSALNRLSSAVYVLMLLTLAAEKGIDVTKLKKN